MTVQEDFEALAGSEAARKKWQDDNDAAVRKALEDKSETDQEAIRTTNARLKAAAEAAIAAIEQAKKTKTPIPDTTYADAIKAIKAVPTTPDALVTAVKTPGTIGVDGVTTGVGTTGSVLPLTAETATGTKNADDADPLTPVIGFTKGQKVWSSLESAPDEAGLKMLIADGVESIEFDPHSISAADMAKLSKVMLDARTSNPNTKITAYLGLGGGPDLEKKFGKQYNVLPADDVLLGIYKKHLSLGFAATKVDNADGQDYPIFKSKIVDLQLRAQREAGLPEYLEIKGAPDHLLDAIKGNPKKGIPADPHLAELAAKGQIRLTKEQVINGGADLLKTLKELDELGVKINITEFGSDKITPAQIAEFSKQFPNAEIHLMKKETNDSPDNKYDPLEGGYDDRQILAFAPSKRASANVPTEPSGRPFIKAGELTTPVDETGARKTNVALTEPALTGPATTLRM